MDEQRRRNYEELYNRAIKVAKARGYSEIAEDFAGDLVVRWLEGKSQHQPIEYSFIEYLRREYGDFRRPSSGDALLRKHRLTAVSSSEGDDGDFNSEEQLERLHASSGLPQAPRDEHEEDNLIYRECLKPTEIELLDMNSFMKPKEISEELGVDSTTIYKRLNRIKKKLEQEHGLRSLKELMKKDSNFTKLSIDWIKL